MASRETESKARLMSINLDYWSLAHINLAHRGIHRYAQTQTYIFIDEEILVFYQSLSKSSNNLLNPSPIRSDLFSVQSRPSLWLLVLLRLFSTILVHLVHQRYPTQPVDICFLVRVRRYYSLLSIFFFFFDEIVFGLITTSKAQSTTRQTVARWQLIKQCVIYLAYQKTVLIIVNQLIIIALLWMKISKVILRWLN